MSDTGSSLTIGCHLSIAKGFAAAARDAVSIGGNTFQFFTRNPRGGTAKALDDADLQAFAQVRREDGISRILAHAPYTLNPCSSKPETREFALQTLADDLARMEATPAPRASMKGTVMGPVVTPPESKATARKLFGTKAESAKTQA